MSSEECFLISHRLVSLLFVQLASGLVLVQYFFTMPLLFPFWMIMHILGYFVLEVYDLLSYFDFIEDYG